MLVKINDPKSDLRINLTRPRVCMILRSFAPRNESGSLRCTAFARYLPGFGVDVSVFCAAPDCSNTQAGTAAHIADDWSDEPEWQHVTRINWPGSRPRSGWLPRFPIIATLARWLARRDVVESAYPALRAHIRKCKPDILFASCAPVETLMLARRAACEFGLPYMTDLRDPWSTATASPHRSIFDYWLERGFETRLHRGAAHVTVASNRSKELLAQEHRLPEEKITFVPNGFLDEDFDGACVPNSTPTQKFLIVHSGELAITDRQPRKKGARLKALLGIDFDPLSSDARSRSATFLLDAVRLVIDESPDLHKKLAIAFTGLKPDNIPVAIRSFPYQDCLALFGRIPSGEAHGIMLHADLLILMATSYFRKRKEFCCTIPAKTYSYLRTGRPVLAMTISSELRDILSRFSQVMFADPFDVMDIARQIRHQLELHEVRATEVTLMPCPVEISQFSRIEGARKLSEIIKSVALNNE